MPGPRYPNLFVAGAAKAGTTTWYEVLGKHPDVFMPEIKEPRFLNPDVTYDYRVETEEAYLALYEDATDEARLGDASPWYLYSEEAPRRIRERVDDPRVVVVLRDPVERIYSLHGQMLMTGAECIEDFREALEAEEARRRGERLPRRVEPREALYYREAALYAPHVRRFLDAFDEDELLFVRFEDFADDPEAVYREICEFADVDPTVDPEIPASNPHQEIRSTSFREFVRDPPQPVQKVTALFPIAWRDRLREVLKGLNREETERDPLDPDLRRELVEHCRPDVEEVEDLLGWDLEAWKTVDESETPPPPSTGNA